MKKRLLAALIIVMVLLFTSCSLMGVIVENISEGGADGVREIKSTESSLTLEIPKSWSKQELNEIATIQMGSRLKDQYIIVIEESGDIFADDFTIDEYTSIIMESMATNVAENDVSPIKVTQIGNGITAKQFEISGIVDRLKIKYLIAIAEVNGIFYQFVAWSSQEKYNEAQPVFERILESANFNVA